MLFLADVVGNYRKAGMPWELGPWNAGWWYGRWFSPLSVGPCRRRAGIPRSLPSRRGAAPGPSGRRDHGGRRQGPGGGQRAGLAAMRWPAASSAASGQREIPTYSASLLHPAHGPPRPRQSPALRTRALQHAQSACWGRRSCLRGICVLVCAAIPAVQHRNHRAGAADLPALLSSGRDHSRANRRANALSCRAWYGFCSFTAVWGRRRRRPWRVLADPDNGGAGAVSCTWGPCRDWHLGFCGPTVIRFRASRPALARRSGERQRERRRRAPRRRRERPGRTALKP